MNRTVFVCIFVIDTFAPLLGNSEPETPFPRNFNVTVWNHFLMAILPTSTIKKQSFLSEVNPKVRLIIRVSWIPDIVSPAALSDGRYGYRLKMR